MTNTNDLTVEQWFNNDACTTTGKRVKEITEKVQIACFNKHVQPIIGSKLLFKVGNAELVKILEDLHNQGCSHGTIMSVYSILCKIFRSAQLSGKITDTPTDGLYHLISQWM